MYWSCLSFAVVNVFNVRCCHVQLICSLFVCLSSLCIGLVLYAIHPDNAPILEIAGESALYLNSSGFGFICFCSVVALLLMS